MDNNKDYIKLVEYKPNKSTILSEAMDCQNSENVVLSVKRHVIGPRINGSEEKFIWTTQYSDDILKTLEEAELKREFFLFRSKLSKLRVTVLHMLKVLTDAFDYRRATFHLSVYYYDVFVDRIRVPPSDANLVALTSFMIAMKLEETEHQFTSFESINMTALTDYTLLQYEEMERVILTTLNFCLMRPTVITFTEHYSNNLLSTDDYNTYVNNCRNRVFERYGPMPIYEKYEDMVTAFQKALFELCDATLTDISLLNALPSKLAATCIAVVRKRKHILPLWPKHLSIHTKQSWNNFMCYFDKIDALCDKQLFKLYTSPPQMSEEEDILLDSPIELNVAAKVDRDHKIDLNTQRLKNYVDNRQIVNEALNTKNESQTAEVAVEVAVEKNDKNYNNCLQEVENFLPLNDDQNNDGFLLIEKNEIFVETEQDCDKKTTSTSNGATGLSFGYEIPITNVVDKIPNIPISINNNLPLEIEEEKQPIAKRTRYDSDNIID